MQVGRKPYPTARVDAHALAGQCRARQAPIGRAAVVRSTELLFGSAFVRKAQGRVPVYAVDLASDQVAQQLRALDAIEPAHRLAWDASAAAALSAAGLPLTAIACVLGLPSHAEAQRRVALAKRTVDIAQYPRVNAGHLRYLTGLPDIQFAAWCKRVNEQNLSVAKLRDALLRAAAEQPQPADLEEYAQRVSSFLGTPVRFIWPQAPGDRAIEITWYTPQDLKGVFEQLARVEDPLHVQADPCAKILRIAVKSADDVASILGGA